MSIYSYIVSNLGKYLSILLFLAAIVLIIIYYDKIKRVSPYQIITLLLLFCIDEEMIRKIIMI